MSLLHFVGAAASAVLLVYLFVALLAPERFS